MQNLSTIDLHWLGPFAWPGLGSVEPPDLLHDPAIARQCGIYLWTVEHAGGYLIYAAGVTRRSFARRFREHTRAYRSGVYTVFDVIALQAGVRQKVWPGFWFKSRTVEMEREFHGQFDAIRRATEELLTGYRVFVAVVPRTPRVLERIEAAIMNCLYGDDGPVSTVPDRGMALAPRWANETPIGVRSTCSVLLHGVPPRFEA